MKKKKKYIYAVKEKLKKNKVKKTKLKFAIGITLFFSIILTTMIVLSSREATRGSGNQVQLNKTHKIPDDYYKTVIQPWKEGDQKLDEDPELPDAMTLHYKYLDVREAIDTRQYYLFKQLASLEQIWLTDQTPKSVGLYNAGPLVIQVSKQGGKKNFLSAPYSYLFGSPPINLIEPNQVHKTLLQKYDDNILIDEDGSFIATLRRTPWSHAIILSYTLKEDSSYRGINTGEVATDKEVIIDYESIGWVTFVLDRGEWRYSGEIWNVVYSDEHLQNRTPSDNENIVKGIIKDDNTVKYYPTTININSGEKIIWENVKGMVFSTDVDKGANHFNSPFLKNQNFAHSFLQKGVYKYIIGTGSNKFEGEIHVL